MLDQFGDNTYRQFRRSFRLDRQADGAVHPVQCFGLTALRNKRLVNGIALFPAAHHADITGTGFQCLTEDYLVIAVAPGNDNDVAVPVDPEWFEDAPEIIPIPKREKTSPEIVE